MAEQIFKKWDKSLKKMAHGPECTADCNHREATAPEGQCPRCGGALRPGKALQNTLSFGLPDFPGSRDLRGQTFSRTGPAKMVDVWKCEECGYSRTK